MGLNPMFGSSLHTDTTFSSAILTNVGIKQIVGVSVGAMGLTPLKVPHLPWPYASTHVLPTSHLFHVIRINASPVSTKMINLELGINDTMVQLIGYPMCESRFAVEPEGTISSTSTAGLPRPTFWGYLNLRPKAIQGDRIEGHRKNPPFGVGSPESSTLRGCHYYTPIGGAPSI